MLSDIFYENKNQQHFEKKTMLLEFLEIHQTLLLYKKE